MQSSNLPLVLFYVLRIPNSIFRWFNYTKVSRFKPPMICMHIFLSARILISWILFLSACIYFYLWEPTLINDHLWEYFRTSSCFYNLCENKQAYERYHLIYIFYHQNMIMIFCWLRTQSVPDFSGTSPEASLKVLTSGTSRRPSWDS